MKKPIVEMKNVNFFADNLNLLKDINLTIYQGEVCAIIGENGAGKSILMKILSGALKRDSGDMLFKGENVRLGSVSEAQNLGIMMIYHDDNLINEFSVLDNIFLGKNITKAGKFFVDKKEQRKVAEQLLKTIDVELDLDLKTSKLSATQKKIIQLMRALIFKAEVLILDEITADCPLYDTDVLFHIIHKLKETGTTIIFISHRMDEIVRVSERIYIMNEGTIVGEKVLSSDNEIMDTDEIILKMAGQENLNRYPRIKNKKGNIVLEVKNVSLKNTMLSNTSFYIRKGEIVGVTGLYGSEKDGLLKVISGRVEATTGDVYIEGISIKGKTQSEFVQKNISYMASEKNVNLIDKLDVKNNIVLSNLKKTSKHGIVSNLECIYIAQDYINRFNLKNLTHSSGVVKLSKGTRQKLILCKYINADAKVMIFEEPTSNLDVVSKVEYYNILNELAKHGKAIIIASTDFTELVGMCDRVYILQKDKIAVELDEKDLSLINITHAVIGESDD